MGITAPSLPVQLDAREVKSRADFVAIASRYTSLYRSGRQYVGLCPFHRERHPSFYIHPEKKVFHCFGCGAGGDLFRFVMVVEGCDFQRALEIVAAFSGAGGPIRKAPLPLPAIVRQVVRPESFADAAARIVATLPAPGFIPSCPRCSASMVFRPYRRNRFGGVYSCLPCSLFFGPPELRQKLLAERGSRCQWCQAGNCPVQMHHILKSGDRFDPASMVLLCFNCRDDSRKLLVIDLAFRRRSRQGPERSEGPSVLIARPCEPHACAVGELPPLACLAEAAYENERTRPAHFHAWRGSFT